MIVRAPSSVNPKSRLQSEVRGPAEVAADISAGSQINTFNCHLYYYFMTLTYGHNHRTLDAIDLVSHCCLSLPVGYVISDLTSKFD